MTPEDLEDLKRHLDDCVETLTRAERERDNWEPDVENSDHVAPYNATLDECADTLPEWLNHVSVSSLMRYNNWSVYIDGWNSWEDSIRGERARRQMWSDYDELCDACDEAESERDDAQAKLDEAEHD